MWNAADDITHWDVLCRKLAVCCHLCYVSSLWGPVYKHRLTLMPALIINYVHYKAWIETTYPFPNVNCATSEVSEWIRNFMKLLNTPRYKRHNKVSMSLAIAFIGYAIWYVNNARRHPKGHLWAYILQWLSFWWLVPWVNHFPPVWWSTVWKLFSKTVNLYGWPYRKHNFQCFYLA